MDSLLLGPDHLVVAGVVNDILVYGFRTLFFVSALLLMVIVLLQEGKGGGLASALGGQGAETFGVASGGVNKLTLFLAGLFLLSALGHALAYGRTATKMLREERRGKATETLPPLKDIEEDGGGKPVPPGGEPPREGAPVDGGGAPVPPKDGGGETPAPPK